MKPQTDISNAQIVSVVGARPQFVKAAEVSRALVDAGIAEFLVHTGQHYDHEMSAVFFEALELGEPDLNLGVGSGSHGAQTGSMLAGIEAILQDCIAAGNRPVVLVYGDTNSTLAGALAAIKLHLPIAHVEAGLRSFRMEMPEEVNRILTDRISTALYCPTQLAVDNLAAEGVRDGVFMTGDVMCDAVRRQFAAAGPGPERAPYRLATVHRASNTDDADTLQALLEAIADPDCPTILPLHPRTRARMKQFDTRVPARGLEIVAPVGYREMLQLVAGARQVLTDSGGLQKEALMLGTPCITLRNETEWVETVELGWNTLVGADPNKIQTAMAAHFPTGDPPEPYGDGRAAVRIAEHLLTMTSGDNQ